MRAELFRIGSFFWRTYVLSLKNRSISSSDQLSLVIIFQNGSIIRDATICVNCCISCLHSIYRWGVLKTLALISNFFILFKENFHDISVYGQTGGDKTV